MLALPFITSPLLLLNACNANLGDLTFDTERRAACPHSAIAYSNQTPILLQNKGRHIWHVAAATHSRVSGDDRPAAAAV